MDDLYITKYPALTEQEKEILYHNLTPESREKIILSHLGCIKSAMQKYRGYLDNAGMDFEDVFYDCLSEVWKSSANFNPEKGAFSTLIYLCVRNTVGNKLRKDTNHPYPKTSLNEELCDEDDRTERGDMVPDSMDVGRNLELKITIEEIFRKMPKRDQELITLYIEGYSQKELAEKYGIGQAAISRILQSFRKTLAIRLGETKRIKKKKRG